MRIQFLFFLSAAYAERMSSLAWLQVTLLDVPFRRSQNWCSLLGPLREKTIIVCSQPEFSTPLDIFMIKSGIVSVPSVAPHPSCVHATSPFLCRHEIFLIMTLGLFVYTPCLRRFRGDICFDGNTFDSQFFSITYYVTKSASLTSFYK